MNSTNNSHGLINGGTSQNPTATVNTTTTVPTAPVLNEPKRSIDQPASCIEMRLATPPAPYRYLSPPRGTERFSCRYPEMLGITTKPAIITTAVINIDACTSGRDNSWRVLTLGPAVGARCARMGGNIEKAPTLTPNPNAAT